MGLREFFKKKSSTPPPLIYINFNPPESYQRKHKSRYRPMPHYLPVAGPNQGFPGNDDFYNPRQSHHSPMPSNYEHAPPVFGQSQASHGGREPSMHFANQDNGPRSSRRGMGSGMQFAEQGFGPRSSRAGPRSVPSMGMAMPSSPRGGISAHDFANPMPNHPPFPSPQHPQSQPVRTGKLPMGAPLPPGIQDPFAKTSVKPQGIHGLREHVPGMTHMDFRKYGDAEDPQAQWKLMEDMAKMKEKHEGREGGRRRR